MSKIIITNQDLELIALLKECNHNLYTRSEIAKLLLSNCSNRALIEAICTTCCIPQFKHPSWETIYLVNTTGISRTGVEELTVNPPVYYSHRPIDLEPFNIPTAIMDEYLASRPKPKATTYTKLSNRKYYFYMEQPHEDMLETMQRLGAVNLRATAQESNTPVHRIIQQKAWRGPNCKTENVFYLSIKRLSKSLFSAFDNINNYNRTCVVFLDGKRYQFSSYQDDDYKALRAIYNEQVRTYIDSVQRDNYNKSIAYIMQDPTATLNTGYVNPECHGCAISPEVKFVNTTDEVLEKVHNLHAMYNEHKQTKQYTLYSALCYVYDLPNTLPSERDPMDMWGKAQPTTYVSHEQVDDLFYVDKNNQLHRIQETKSQPTEVYYKPRKEEDLQQYLVNLESIKWYLKNSIPFAKRPTEEFFVPSYIVIDNVAYSTDELVPAMTPQEEAQLEFNYLELHSNPLNSKSVSPFAVLK